MKYESPGLWETPLRALDNGMRHIAEVIVAMAVSG